MLCKEDNERITRVGPGTPMGELLRQYWIPGLLSSELATPDCRPLRVRLLGENLIAFRDSSDRFRLAANAGNDYEFDFEKQRRNEEYTGITGIHLQDQAITESMGPVLDRGHEHLGSSDAMVIRVRRRPIENARAGFCYGRLDARESGRERPPGRTSSNK